MRKGIKIKAYTLLLAWAMIFAHSIIPHNHPDECYNQFRNLIISLSHNSRSGECTTKFKNHPEEEQVCHISGFLFPQFNQDDLISDSFGNISVSPLFLTISYSYSASDSLITEHWNNSASFRAPPIA